MVVRMKLRDYEGSVRKLAPILSVVALVLTLVACDVGRAALSFSPDRLPSATAGQAYEAIITVSGNETPVGDIYVSNGALPAGITLDFSQGSADNATLSGTPTAAGTYVFTVSAWCLGTNVSGQMGETNYTLVVN
jgi:hypothetical protein